VRQIRDALPLTRRWFSKLRNSLDIVYRYISNKYMEEV
jgi:hypothetical protein